MKDILQSKSDHNNTKIIGSDSVNGVITKDDLIERAIVSNIAIIEGRVKSVKDIREEIKVWRSGLKK